MLLILFFAISISNFSYSMDNLNQQNLNASLINAALAGDYENAINYLDKGAQHNAHQAGHSLVCLLAANPKANKLSQKLIAYPTIATYDIHASLIQALKGENSLLAITLLKKGALTSNDLNDPKTLNELAHNPVVIKYLLENDKLSKSNRKKILKQAINAQSSLSVKILLSYKKLSVTCKHLQMCCKIEDGTILDFLLKKYNYQHCKNNNKPKKLHYHLLATAIESGNIDAVKLISNYFDLLRRDHNNETTLMTAAYVGSPTILSFVLNRTQELLHYDAQKINDFVNAVDHDGLTALHLATAANNIENIQILLDQAKADPTIASTNGLTPLFLAHTNANHSIITLLQDASMKRQLNY